jgi:hypothetical protein
MRSDDRSDGRQGVVGNRPEPMRLARRTPISIPDIKVIVAGLPK